MSRAPGRLVEMSRFFVCLWRLLKNSKKPCVAGVKTFFFGEDQENHAKNHGSLEWRFFFWDHLKIHAKTTTLPVLCLKNMVALTIPPIRENRFTRLTLHHWLSCISKFCDIRKNFTKFLRSEILWLFIFLKVAAAALLFHWSTDKRQKFLQRKNFTKFL